MRYNVEGADTSTGADRVITVEADDERTAEALARRDGLLVSAVFESQTLSPAEKLDLMVGEAIAKPDAPPIAPTALPYRSPDTPSSAIPSYAGLKFASSLLFVFAMLSYTIGGIALILFVLSMVGSTFYRPSFGGAVVALTATFWPIFVGGIMHALSSACVALRDVARNSFR